MKVNMTLGGESFVLETAAISCVRYRARYGHSVMTDLRDCDGEKERERVLLRVCYEMIVAHRPEYPQGARRNCMAAEPPTVPRLPAFAKLAYRDRQAFRRQAEEAVAALLDADGWTPDRRDDTGEEFDEYGLLSSMAVVGLDPQLLYELPVLHLAQLLDRIAAQRDPERKTYRRMSEKELAEFYNLHL